MTAQTGGRMSCQPALQQSSGHSVKTAVLLERWLSQASFITGAVLATRLPGSSVPSWEVAAKLSACCRIFWTFSLKWASALLMHGASMLHFCRVLYKTSTSGLSNEKNSSSCRKALSRSFFDRPYASLMVISSHPGCVRMASIHWSSAARVSQTAFTVRLLKFHWTAGGLWVTSERAATRFGAPEKNVAKAVRSAKNTFRMLILAEHSCCNVRFSWWA